MIDGLLLLVAANAASLLGAGMLLTRVKTGEAALDVVLLLVLRLLLISGAVLLAGLTHTLTRWGLGLPSLLALALLLWRGAHRQFPRLRWPSCGMGMGVAILIVAGRLALQVWFFSPHLGDALAYHLPKIGEWIRAGAFTRELGLHPHVTFPSGFELIETWWVVFLHHDVLIEAAGVEFLILAFGAVCALGRSLGLDFKQSGMAALLYTLTPGLHLSATSCLNDAPVAAMVVATAALVFGRAPLALLGITVGLGLGIKATYAYALPGLVLLAFLVRKEPRSSPASPACPWLLAAAGLAVGGFWYVRNLAWYGNPVFPVGESGYRSTGVAVQVGPRWSSFVGNSLDLLNYRIYDLQTALGANVDDMAGWGPVTFSCGLLALYVAMVEHPGFRRLGTAFLVSLASCLLLIIHDPWCLKYVFFFPAVPSLAIPPLLQTSRSLRIVAGAALLLSFAATILPYDLPFPSFRSLFRQPWRVRTALEEPAEIRGEETLACFGGSGERSYLLYRPDFSRHVVYLRSESSGDLDATLARSGARAGYFRPVGAMQQRALEECCRSGRLEEIGTTPFYRIRSDAGNTR